MLTDAEFETFVGGAMDGLIETPPSAVSVLVADGVDAFGQRDVILAAFTDITDSDPLRAFQDQIGPLQLRGALGMAVRVNWSPAPTGQSSPAWCLVLVAEGRRAEVVVHRDCDAPQAWHQIGIQQAPWFALSTAGALRGVLAGNPLPEVKTATVGQREHLMRRPDQTGRDIPTDADGTI